ncbi:MAG: DNA repair protein RecN [Deinococcus sp.]|nr:DNA repair protein RecN [Deinococcus sp.]
MLELLRIENLAIIDSAEIEFGPGLNVLTGETGAGKSIIVGALGLLRGARASPDLIRTSAQEARISAIFRSGEQETIVGRRIATQRSSTTIDGELTSVGSLAQLTSTLLDIYGQHDHQSLLQPAEHLALLDDTLGSEQLLASVQEGYRRVQALQSELEALRRSAAERARELDIIAFQCREIDAVGVRPGEEEELKQERTVLAHAQALAEAARGAVETLYEEEGAAVERLDLARRMLERAGTTDHRLIALAQELAQAQQAVQATAQALQEYAERLEADPHRLEEVEARLASIDRLRLKYGSTCAEILAFRTQREADRKRLEGSGERTEHLEQALARAQAQLQTEALALSQARQTAARELSQRITQELKALGMGDARLVIHVNRQEEGSGPGQGPPRYQCGPKGIDQVQLLFSANPDEPPRPLVKVASGGELSRLMLAIRTVSRPPVDTLVFDEVDVGIGGEAAVQVGERLAQLSRSAQVIVITHLPQVASRAARHFWIAKTVRRGRTLTSVSPLAGQEREEELARMLSGTKSREALAHARELLRRGSQG